jgi:hypothetical protein
MNILKLDMPFDVLWNPAFLRFGVNVRSCIKKLNDIRRSAVRRRDIGHERKHIASLDSTKNGRLFKSRKVECTSVSISISTHHETSEELFRGKLLIRHQPRAIPEHQGDDEEGK